MDRPEGVSVNGSADSAESLRSRRSRISEDHEIYAPREVHNAPKKLKNKILQGGRKDKKQQSGSKKNQNTAPTSRLANKTTPKEAAPEPAQLRPEDARQLAINKETERIARAATALDNRGNEYFERGYYDKAMAAYSRALKLKRRTFHSMLEEADEWLDETRENEKIESGDMDPKLLVSMATSINNIGYLRQRAGEATPDETMAAYKKSLRIKRKILGDDSLSVGKTLNNIGSVYFLKKEYDGALPAYAEALQIMEANLGSDHPDVATVMSNMGDVLFAMKMVDESLERYRKALNVRWNNFGEKDQRTARLLEKIARIEIGDKMPTPRGNVAQGQVYDWDESELYDLDLRPISEELALLKDEVQLDLASVDKLEKKLTVRMVKDKARLVSGMRALSRAQEKELNSSGGGAWVESSLSYESTQREDSNRESDDKLLSPRVSPFVPEDLTEAKVHIKDRLTRIRSQRSQSDDTTEKFNSSLSSLQHSTSRLTINTSNLLQGNQESPTPPRPVLPSLGSEDAMDNVVMPGSAIKLKQGIDTLRSSGDNNNQDGSVAENGMKPSTALQLKLGIDSLRSFEKDPVHTPNTENTETTGEANSTQESDPLPSMEETVKRTGPKIIHATWLGEIET
eukprot:Nitzschia sp. Nitz4//scaffold77_size91520//62853//64736//NITZ4_004899-RA/size91520-processed-gene-0.53-mRNA-1//-1//CDS//3329558018//9283//frame0